MPTHENEPTRTTDETGREIIVYPNGAKKDAKTGYWINGPTDPADNPVLADPRGMLARRNEKSKQVARDAIDEGAGLDPSQWGTGEGWRRLIVHTVKTYMQSRNIRGMAEVLGRLGTAAGYLSSRDGEAQPAERGIVTTTETLREIMVMLEEEVQARVEKARAIDGKAT